MREFEKKSLHDHPAPIPPPTKHIIDDEGEKLPCDFQSFFVMIYKTVDFFRSHRSWPAPSLPQTQAEAREPPVLRGGLRDGRRGAEDDRGWREEKCQQSGPGGDRGRGDPGQEEEGAARRPDSGRGGRGGQNIGPLLSLSGACLDTGEYRRI